ncbi:Zinc finger, C2H2 type family protein [Tritrichomonas foetus]|uniref:Zinc finger, C2H2 type family protein n=1 Tax=Tritrichomonas foetus TaxID=1144522 RepID=A0A1J4JDB3_9EUKA|nr:Zinc finger, C2H2 type family protein [Tritrichomonas foetus]|eukprot:OHS95421.1 Zinc finger, C2H2 type family protein [Tritrichomonas foetus]
MAKMTSTPLEKLRQQYQDIEDYRKQAVHLMLNPPKTVKEEAYCKHHEARLAREIQNTSKSILSTLENLTNNSLQNSNNTIQKVEDPVAAFYDDLERRIHFHQEIADREPESAENEDDQNKNKNISDMTMNDMVLDIKGAIHLSLFYDNDRYQEWRRQMKNGDDKKSKKKKRIVVSETDEALTKFSGEECFGQYLDLFEIHRKYLVVCPQERVGYLEFLEHFESAKNLNFIPRNQQGQQFLQSFIDYLESFIVRSDPFFDMKSCQESILKSFLNQQQNPTQAPKMNQNENDGNKNSENYCPYCDRSFDTPELLQSHTKQKSHKKNENKAQKLGGLDFLIEDRRMRKMKHDKLCYTLLQLIERVRSKFHATIENTRRRQTLSAAVMQAEANLDAPIVFDESDDEDEQHFYNPKGLPLGWDGKPIPYWLYKLHGLSVEYKCEICGNKSYWGALAFERHFFDNKHINGLKALGIPPTRHFLYVTGVNEAMSLFDKIKKSLSQEVWQPGDEEIETEDGQVMSYKIYRDLTKQGIIKPKIAQAK